MIYAIQTTDVQNWIIGCEYLRREDAEYQVREMEEMDRKWGCYTPGLYEIIVLPEEEAVYDHAKDTILGEHYDPYFGLDEYDAYDPFGE